MELSATSLSESFRSGASPRNTRCQCAVSSTDFWASYENVIPKKRHRAVGKESSKTNHIGYLLQIGVSYRLHDPKGDRLWIKRHPMPTIAAEIELDSNHLQRQNKSSLAAYPASRSPHPE